VAMKAMEEDVARVHEEQERILKRIANSAKAAKKQQAGFDRFAELRSRYPSFSGKPVAPSPLLAATSMESRTVSADKCAECVDAFVKAGGCKAWRSGADPKEFIPEACSTKNCEEAAATRCEIPHTKAKEEHMAPVHYSAVPTGHTARQADADLASGADASRKEDWMVHQATYDQLHPSASALKKAEAKKQEEQPDATPLKDAQAALHHGLDTIDETKTVISTPLVKLTLPEAKSKCQDIRTLAQKKCDSDEHDTHYFCLTEGTKHTDCDAHKMKDAAECKVAHQTAYNKCYDLWQRAKQNIADAQEQAAAPMAHTDDQVQSMADGTEKCATLMKKAKGECSEAYSKYKATCKATMMTAVDASVVELQLQTDSVSTPESIEKVTAETEAKDTSSALKHAEETLTKETASPALKDALVKCALKKNVAKRTCINSVHAARNGCDKLTSTNVDDHDQSR